MDPSKPSTSSALLPVTKRPRLQFGAPEARDCHPSKAFEEANSDRHLLSSNKLVAEEKEMLIGSTMIKMHQADMIYKDGQLRERDRTLNSLNAELASAEGRAKLGNWKLARAEKEVAQLRGKVDTLKSQLLLANEKNAMLEKKLKRSLGGGMETGASSGAAPSTSILTPPHSKEFPGECGLMSLKRENRNANVRDEVPASSEVKSEVIPDLVRNEPLSQLDPGTEIDHVSSADPTTSSKTDPVVSSIVDRIYRSIQAELCNGRRFLRPRWGQKLD